MILTIAVADIKRLVGIPAGDTSQDVLLGVLLAAEQPPWEWALDSGILGQATLMLPPALPLPVPPLPPLPLVPVNPGLLSTLSLGVAEALAGSYLLSLGRFPHLAEPLPLSVLVPQAAAVLVVAVSDLKRLLQVDPTDSSQDVALAALITAEQLALEYALDPAVLAAAVNVATPNAGLRAWLTLGISEQIAGHALEQSGRVPGIADDIQISSLHFTTSRGAQPDKLGAELVAQGTARLLPFSRHIRAEHALKPVLNQPDLIKLGAELSARGLARLSPFLKAARSLAGSAAGLVPDDTAQVPQLVASSVLPGAAAGVSESVFVGAFRDIPNLSSPDLADAQAAAEGEGMIWWGSDSLGGPD